jgi:hypothetical protein
MILEHNYIALEVLLWGATRQIITWQMPPTQCTITISFGDTKTSPLLSPTATASHTDVTSPLENAV